MDEVWVEVMAEGGGRVGCEGDIVLLDVRAVLMLLAVPIRCVW